MNDRHLSELDGIIARLELCIEEGGGEVPSRLNKHMVKEVLDDFVALYNSGKVAA